MDFFFMAGVVIDFGRFCNPVFCLFVTSSQSYFFTPSVLELFLYSLRVYRIFRYITPILYVVKYFPFTATCDSKLYKSVYKFKEKINNKI